MGTSRFCAAILPLLLGSAICHASDGPTPGPASNPTPAQASGQNIDPDAKVDTHLKWDSLAVIDARPKGRGFFGYAGEYYSELDGRKMEMSELVLGVGITDNLSLWYGKQQYLLFGHFSQNRFRLGVDTYGGKWSLKTPTQAAEDSWAVEFEIERPDTAVASTENSTASFGATHNYVIGLDYGTDHDMQYQISYAAVQGGGGATNAGVVAVGAGRDVNFGRRLRNVDFRLQAQIIEQSYTDTVESKNFEFKGVLYGALGYNITNAFRLEADGTLFPAGMPLADGRFTGLSSFQIYRPGGAAANLRTDTVAFASIRLQYHVKF